MDSRTSLIYYLLESRLVKSPREDSSASSCNGRHPNVIQKNDDKQESHHLTVSDLGQKRPDHFPAQRWGDKEYLHDLIVQNLPERVSVITSSDEDHQINGQVIDLKGVPLSAEGQENHPQKLFNKLLTGLAVKGYFLPPDVMKLHGFSKLISFVKVGWGAVCPCCLQGEVEKAEHQVWMRLIPYSKHFKCKACGARFLTIGNRGKILFKGSTIED